MKKLLATVTAVALSLAMVALPAVTASAEGEVPETEVPETIVTETTEPQTTEPETTEPDTTEPESTEPTEPETTEPETTEPETTEPETTEPESTEPESTEPETFSSLRIQTNDVTGPPEEDDEKKVTICHWDQSDKWTSVTVAIAALGGSGHIDPSTEDTHAFDIVPPFDGYDGKNYDATSDNVPEYNASFPFDGLTGQAILEAGCKDPVVEDDEVAVTATPTDELCEPISGELSPGSILVTIDPSGGATVEYRVKGDLVWIPLTANPITDLPGGTTLEFKVTAAGGYTLVTPSTFEKTVAEDNAVGCQTFPGVTPLASQDPGCTVPSSFTIGNSIDDPAALSWTANGAPIAEGLHVVNSAATIELVATANPGYGIEGDPQTEWTFTFPKSATCDLTTLALTGLTDTTPALALTAFLGLLGLAMVRSGIRANRFRQEA
jgi:hypothetical protein